MMSIGFSNYTKGIKDPSVFNVPPECKNDTFIPMVNLCFLAHGHPNQWFHGSLLDWQALSFVVVRPQFLWNHMAKCNKIIYLGVRRTKYCSNDMDQMANMPPHPYMLKKSSSQEPVGRLP